MTVGKQYIRMILPRLWSNHKAFFLGCLSVCLVAFFFVGSVRAAETGEVGIIPANPNPAVKYSDSWLIYRLEPGQTKEDAVKLINHSDQIVPVKLYPVDAVTTSDGSFAPLEEYAQRKSVGSWITISQYRVDMPPHSETVVPLTITIPEGTDVGDHAGAVIMEKINQTIPKAGQSGVAIVSRIGVRVFETVPGEVVKQLVIKEFTWKFQEIPPEQTVSGWRLFWYSVQKFIGLRQRIVFSLHLQNQGNVRLEPTAQISVTDLWGKQVGVFEPDKFSDYLQTIDLGLILPHKETLLPLLWQEATPLAGRYEVTAAVQYADNQTPLQATAYIWIVPYNLIGMLCAIVFFILLLLYARRMAVLKEILRLPKHHVEQGENLLDISQHYGISLKRLAQVNKLSIDASLKPGLVIVLPQGNIFGRAMKRVVLDPVTILLAVLILLLITEGYFYFNYYKPQREQALVGNGPAVSLHGEDASETQTVALAHDEQRKLDLAQLSNALEQYHKDQGGYPDTGGQVIKTYESDTALTRELVDKNYLTALPLDPLHPRFDYRFYSDGQSYELSSILENSADAQGERRGRFTVYKITGQAE